MSNIMILYPPKKHQIVMTKMTLFMLKIISMGWMELIKNIATIVKVQMALTAICQNVLQIRHININVNIAITR